MKPNLWAPFAFSFDVPVALSKSVVSVSGVTNDSVIDNPTRYDGEKPYLSKTILCALTFTNWPRIKNIPSSIAAEEPVSVAPEVISVKVPLTLSEVRVSPSRNLLVTPTTD